MPYASLAVRLSLALSLFAAGALAQDDETVSWMGNYQEALKEARATGKPIFVEFRCEA